MKTFAFVDANGDIAGIGLIYLESGAPTPAVAQFIDAAGEDDGILAYGESVKHDPLLTTVLIDTMEMPGGGRMTYDKTFRVAYKHGGGRRVIVDVTRAKEVTHERRRAKREVELAPLDKEVNMNIVNQAKVQQLESQRQAVRDRYAVIQANIDACTTPEELKAIIDAEGL